MKKLHKPLALVLSLVLVAGLLAACGGSGSGDTGASTPPADGGTSTGSGNAEFNWKMGTIYNDPQARPTNNSWGLSMQKFIELVNEKSDGRIEITPYYNSVLGASNELMEQLRRGELEVFYGQPMSTVDPRYGVFSVPYLFENYDDVEKYIASPDAPLFAMAQEWMAENNSYLVCSGSSVFRGFFNTKHEVATVDDVGDLKVRIYEDPVVSSFWSGICSASPIPYSEVYTSLQTNTVDGLEFAATSIVSDKFYELGPHYSDINWQWTWAANIVVSDKYWNELPDDLKEIVTECAWEAMEVQKAEESADADAAEATLQENGVEYYHLTDADRETWVTYARSLDDKMREIIGAETFDAVMDAIK